MLLIRKTSQFKKSLKKKLLSGNFDKEGLEKVINTLAHGKKLTVKHRDHSLSGALAEHRECHIKPDFLLVYKIDGNNLILVLVNLGSHTELFG